MSHLAATKINYCQNFHENSKRIMFVASLVHAWPPLLESCLPVLSLDKLTIDIWKRVERKCEGLAGGQVEICL